MRAPEPCAMRAIRFDNFLKVVKSLLFVRRPLPAFTLR